MDLIAILMILAGVGFVCGAYIFASTYRAVSKIEIIATSREEERDNQRVLKRYKVSLIIMLLCFIIFLFFSIIKWL